MFIVDSSGNSKFSEEKTVYKSPKLNPLFVIIILVIYSVGLYYFYKSSYKSPYRHSLTKIDIQKIDAEAKKIRQDIQKIVELCERENNEKIIFLKKQSELFRRVTDDDTAYSAFREFYTRTHILLEGFDMLPEEAKKKASNAKQLIEAQQEMSIEFMNCAKKYERIFHEVSKSFFRK